MGIDELIATIWRRRRIFALAAGVSLLAIVAVTLSLSKTYKATATIFVGQSIEGNLAEQVLDSTQGEQLTRTFTTLASSPDTADAVIGRLPRPIPREELLEEVSVSPVERAQLLEVSAEEPSPGEAALVANIYATVFVERMSVLHKQGRVPTTVSISARAVPPGEAASPNIPIYIGFGILISLVIGVGVALLRDRLDRGIRIEEGEESLLGRPILARIPASRATLETPIRQRIAVDRLVDSMRVLRTNLELAPDVRARSVLITSPGTGEGKTMLARELALTIASDGDSVALVELDLRRPTMNLAVAGGGIQRGPIGMAEVLAGRASLRDAICTDEAQPGLSVIHSGTLAASPARLLRSPAAASVFAELRSSYDWVVVDTPPILVADDVLLLTSHVDGSILVVDETSTPLPSLRAALARLQNIDARLLGIALNKAPIEPSPYYMPEGFVVDVRTHGSQAQEREQGRTSR